MNATAQVLVAVLAVVLVVGGGVLASHLSERERLSATQSAAPVVPEGVGLVLSVLRSSAVVVDADGTVVKASAPAYALGLVSAGRLQSEELAGLVEQVRRDGEIREAELHIERAGGAPRYVAVRCAPLSSTLVLALVEDRTRERRVEAVRRDFVANVSHELKTPVGAIKLLAEAASDAADDPVAIRRFTDRMQTESERLSRLVQQIIELSRLQGDDPLDAPVVVLVDEVVAAAVDATATDASARGLEVDVQGDRGLEVLGNEEQVRAAVTNLVANAVAYSQDGSTVLVTTRSDQGMVEISVVDRGIGIPSHELDRIFERFYRVDPARHRSTGGTGLGLSIVKHVAATHGGEIKVKSLEGQGSTFTLTLPSAPSEGTSMRRPA